MCDSTVTTRVPHPGEAALRAAYEKAYPTDKHFCLYYAGPEALFETAKHLAKEDIVPSLNLCREGMKQVLDDNIDAAIAESMERFE